MKSTAYDVVIVGGGVHGAGVAQASAAAGYRALLIEKTAIAAATSRSSSKLIHGGLRYLESGQFGLVRESLHERKILLRIAPELVQLVPFNIPIYRQTTRRPWQIRAGLSLYALLGGLTPDTRFSRLPQSKWGELDGLKTKGLQAVYRYWDGQTDDAALTAAVVQSALSLGAELACPATFVRAMKQDREYLVDYLEGSTEQSCRGKTLVNATGPWINHVLNNISPAAPALAVDLIQGSHILLSAEIYEGVYFVEAPWDRRAVFVMPWRNKTLVGTTETPFSGDPDQLQVRAEEIRYLQRTLLHYFPTYQGDVIDSFSGLRVLPKQDVSAFHRPREVQLHHDRRSAPGLLSIYGGKLTGYRATAAKVIRLLRPVLPDRASVADTSKLILRP